ncbi:adenylyl-sulfate kinase [Zavarzinia sp. CC-PAN008]|uniref:adenylyl-sulfate kinase n=1 Tax=Zavarzinia sp. CC-PAN008 TaxID=3243332 RepID=UPI003F7459FC
MPKDLVEGGAPTPRSLLRIVIVGHVDHGKSTLVGRLLHDTDNLPDGKLEELRATSAKRGMPFEWAFLMDALQAERDQGITIDSSQIWLRTPGRDLVIIDAPGHKEFLKNMITGAASADAALLVIDGHEGVKEQSRRHGYLLHLLGIRQILVAVNKMDLVDDPAARFVEVAEEIRAYLSGLGVEPAHIVPISARDGDNVVQRSDRFGFHDGPTVFEALDGFAAVTMPSDRPLRLPVQDVYKFDERRIIAGKIASGRLSVGDTIVFSPSNKTARIASIEHWGGPQPLVALAGQSVGITLDEQIFIERGELISHLDHAPMETDVFRARLFWLAHNPLTKGSRWKLRLGNAEAEAEVQSIERVIDATTLDSKAALSVERNAVAEVIFRTRKLVAIDPHDRSPATGRFVVVDKGAIAGGGLISMDGYADQRQLVTRNATNITPVETVVTTAIRERRNGHRGGVLWLTGLSGSGKSTLAIAVERALFERGYQVFVLDGDNIRTGLNANLGFSPEDRAENIRRVGEVAALFAAAGTIVITAFISPYRSDRERARAAVPRAFHEIHVAADVETCEKRDPKGLYAKARAGEIKDFTGISAPYEAPESPELVVETGKQSVEASVFRILDYVDRHFAVPSTEGGGI